MTENFEENQKEILNSEANLVTQTNYEEIENQVELLNKQKLEFVESKRYPEAEVIKNQIADLQAKLNKRKKKNLTSQHQNEIKLLEDKYNQEVEAINNEWNEKFSKFEEDTKVTEDNMNQRHNKELSELENLINSANKNIKFSSQFLQYCISEESLVKQQKYSEAHVVTLKKQALEKLETEKHNKDTNEKNKKKIEKLQKKQFLEKSTFKKKIEVEIEMLQKQKDNDLAKINYKFKVRKNGLDIQHQQEKKLNENEKLMKQKTVADTIRNIKGTKTNFFSATKITKQTDSKVIKTEIDISTDMQNLSLNEK